MATRIAGDARRESVRAGAISAGIDPDDDTDGDTVIDGGDLHDLPVDVEIELDAGLPLDVDLSRNA